LPPRCRRSIEGQPGGSAISNPAAWPNPGDGDMTKGDSTKNESAKSDTSAGRARPGPTIDLKAKEISSASAPEADKAKAGKAEHHAKTGAAQTEGPPPPPPGGGSRRAPIWPLPLVVAVGAGLPLFGLGWWLGDNVTGRTVQAVAPSPAPVPPEIVARLDKIEAALAKPPAADPALRAMADSVAALGRRLDDLARTANEARSRADAAATSAEAAQKAAGASPAGVAQADLDALSKRIAALEQATTNKDSALAERISGEAEDKAGRLAVVASVLRNAVERGNPYVAELAAAKRLAPDDALLAPLEAFATTGIPSERALARELSSLAQPMIKLVGEPAQPTGVLEKLQASAERLIRIRPVGDIPGDEPPAVVSRIELKATRTDIEGALQELAKLPPKIRAPAEDWIRKATGREAAVAASRQFAHDALAALGKPGL
jgi:hypothetical protein